MIGFSCPALSVTPFHEAAKLILPHFEHWEIVSEADHFLPDIKAQVKELLETTHLRLSIHAPYSDINLAAFDARARKYSVETICNVIDISAGLGIGPVTIHPGTIGPIQRLDRERVLRLTRAGLEQIARDADNSSTMIAFENMPDMRFCICRTREEMEKMLEGLDIGMCLDIGHANTNNQIREFLGMEKRFVNMHVHDNMGKTDEHLTLGSGNIDFTVLKNIRYKGNHIIEGATPDMPQAVNSKRFLQKLLD